MIEITLPVESYEYELEVDRWCTTYVGRVARNSKHVGELYPWYPSKRFAHTVYCFAREQDAFLFKLRWL